MRVLVACEMSGIVREAFAARGHDAWSCDLKPTLRPSNKHVQCDVLKILDDGWDLMIGHPECTFLSGSGIHWNGRVPGRQAETEKAKDFFLQLWNADIPKIGLENPVGIMSTVLRKPDQIIQPFDFGDDASKKTCLWLKGLPCLTPTKYFPPRIVIWKGKEVMRWSNQTDSGQSNLGPSDDRKEIRSLTYQGIADAMAAQWG